MSKPCHIYIVGHSHPTYGHAVKVGITSSLASRMSSLQTGSCEPLEMYFSAMLPDRDTALQAEGLFHEIFDDYCIRGEWFGMPPGRAMFMLGNIVSEMARLLYPPHRIEEATAKIGLSAAFESFHNSDGNTQAEWVNDWCQREEGRQIQ